MRYLVKLCLVLSLAAFSAQAAFSASVADLAKAQALIYKINEVVDKYRELTIELEAPKSIDSGKGKFLVPFKDDGQMTAWANKALEAQAGAAVGEKAGSAVGKALATKVPLGGFMGAPPRRRASRWVRRLP